MGFDSIPDSLATPGADASFDAFFPMANRLDVIVHADEACQRIPHEGPRQGGRASQLLRLDVLFPEHASLSNFYLERIFHF
eukprot:395250-Prorocentrum_minimum.AAC.7